MSAFRQVRWTALLVGALAGVSQAATPDPQPSAVAAIDVGSVPSEPAPTPSGSVSQEEAARFLMHATFGGTIEEIERAAAIGLEDWLDEQFVKPIGYHEPELEQRRVMGGEISTAQRRHSWWKQAMQGSDPLRQRVTFAMSQIFVISDEVGTVNQEPEGAANYYDMLLRNAFGNYRDILRDMSLHPMMGVYLSHLGNQRSNPAAGRFPDENYAREIMQLFSIGLFELNLDGTEKLDGTGQPIPTYGNEDITELAKIFTGFSFDSPEGTFRDGTPVWDRPMRMFQAWHEPGPKYLLRGKFVPPGQSGMQDFEDAIDNLFEHPNVGPFFARRFIQRLVSSNPSPAYIERVATAFNDNGNGVRGDMKAVIRAVLLDPEARSLPNNSQITRGRLQESYLRRVHLARAFNAANLAGTFPISDFRAIDDFVQRPLSSPTVFNFFLPDHQPQGEISQAGLFAPEFQIITTVSAISSANALRSQIDGTLNNSRNEVLEVKMDLNDELALANNIPALVDRFDLLLMYGSMSGPMRQVLITALQQLEDPEDRVKMALFLISIAPEYNVVK